MDTKTLAQAVPALPRPAALEPAWRGFRAGTVTGAQLQEASYKVALDYLDDYRWRPAPTPPSAVASYLALDRSAREAMDQQRKSKFFEEHAPYFQSARAILVQNWGNASWLHELAGWAEASGQTVPIQQAIQRVLRTHTTPAEEPWTP